jgi:hypothetical protein
MTTESHFNESGSSPPCRLDFTKYCPGNAHSKTSKSRRGKSPRDRYRIRLPHATRERLRTLRVVLTRRST